MAKIQKKKKMQNNVFFIILIATIILISGCVDFFEQKPSVKLSKGGVTQIGVKQYTELDVGKHLDFVYNLTRGKRYIFFMYYVDKLEVKTKKTKMFSTSKTVSEPLYKEEYQNVDYDLILKNKEGEILDSSTQSSALPEKIEFTPNKSGEYIVTVINDPKESKGKWPAMLISAEIYQENLAVHIEGKNETTSELGYDTYYALFLPENKYSFVKILVPESLDMYQARAICISNDDAVNWSNILYEKYNIEKTKPAEGVEYSSCDKFGEDMNLKLSRGDNCFIQLIGELGDGWLEFKFKWYETLGWKIYENKTKNITEIESEIKAKELKQSFGEVVPVMENTRINSETGEFVISLMPKTKSKVYLSCIDLKADGVCEFEETKEMEKNREYKFNIPRIYDCSKGEPYSIGMLIFWKIEIEGESTKMNILTTKKHKKEYFVLEYIKLNGFCE